jgi:hypothetical protein
MTKLEIDSKSKTIHVQLKLKGESEPITITVGRYEVVDENGTTFLEVKEIAASREWMDVVLRDYVPGRKFEVPHALTLLL